MNLLFVIDARSPIALNWIDFFLKSEHKVHVVSTYPCDPIPGAASLKILPIGFSQLASAQIGKEEKSKRKNYRSRFGSTKFRTALRQRIAPLTIMRASKQLKEEIARINPDLVHAMRIPYEGMVSTAADPEHPLLISIWGNDLTLHARSTRQLAGLTRHALSRCDALHTDCARDARLAQEWGFSSNKPVIVMPGNGGVRRELFHVPDKPKTEELECVSKEHDLLVINPRGVRAYIRNDVFFKSIPLVLQQYPDCQFVCPDMEDHTEIMKWVTQLGISQNVKLLGKQSPGQMSILFRCSRVMVSVSEHDGTPNTLLEAMASGCLPVVGDIESLREWIQDGINGLLVDPADPEVLGSAIIRALQQNDFYRSAMEINQRIIKERADYKVKMQSALEFYCNLIKN